MFSEQSMPVALGVGLALVFGLAFFLIWRYKRKIWNAWGAFSLAHDLELSKGPYPSVKGEVEGRMVAIGSFMARTPGGRAAPRRVVEFKINVGLKGNVPAGLIAGKRALLQGAGKVQTGDPKFDRKIWVDCPDKNAALAYLTPQRKEALYEVSKLGAVVLGATEEIPAMLARTQVGYKPRLEWLEARLSDFLSTARKLDGD